MAQQVDKMRKDMTFKDFCFETQGYIFKDKRGKEVYKYQLYHGGFIPSKLLTNQTSYSYEVRVKK